MAYWYIDSAQYATVTPWAASTAKAAGQLVRQLTTPTVNNERVFVCIIAGTTLPTEPSWNLTKGATTAETAGPTWMECTGQAAVNGSVTNTPASSTVRNTPQSLGKIIANNAGTFYFICTTAGTPGASEPTYNTTAGQTTSDNTCTWTSIGAVGNFTAFGAPHARKKNADTSTWMAPGDIAFIGDDHAETQASANTITSASTIIAICAYYCVDHTKATPGAADLKTTATITTTGANALTIAGGGYYYGITFNSGSGAVSTQLLINGQGSNRTIFDTCALNKLGTSSNTQSISFFSSGGTSSQIDLINTTMQVGNTGDRVTVSNGGILRWRDTPSAIQGATIPAALFNVGSGSPGVIECENVDISALGSGNIIWGAGSSSQIATIINSKLGAGFIAGPLGSGDGERLDIIDCDSGATNYMNSRTTMPGSHAINTILVRTGGFSDGVTSVSWQIATGTRISWWVPFECMRIAIKNSILSTNRVVALGGIWNATALPNNDDIWVEVDYPGSASSPIGSKATQTKANGLTANAALPADAASAWDSAVTARANTFTYAVGNTIKVASNPGRVFFCTAIGTGISAGSEPAGYASAVDGGAVTDGGATFRAGVRFGLTVTLSSPQPAQAGYIYATVKAAKSSATFWIDPLIRLS